MKTVNNFTLGIAMLLLSLSIFGQTNHIQVTGTTTGINGNIYHMGGNVGIGTNSPKEALEVNGKILSSGERPIVINSAVGSIEYNAPISGSGWTLGQKLFGSSGTYLGGWRAHGVGDALRYYFVGIDYTNPLLAIIPEGNVGIGTKSPTEKLDVNGVIKIRGLRPILLNSNVGSIEFNAQAGGWTLGQKFFGANGTDHGGWRAFGFNDDLTYYYVGNSYQNPLFLIKPNGNAAINGKLEAKEIKVTTTPTADFVFAEDYTLPNLNEVEQFVKTNQHLPEIPSAKEMQENGVNMGELQIKLLQKIEELTLYVIELKKENEAIKEENKAIKQSIENIKN